jgi:deoxyribose-phosphate aldolase
MKDLCDDAVAYSFAAVCVHPFWVRLAAERLSGSGSKVATVIGFPMGANTARTKILEAREAIKSGASELDFVMNLGAFKSGLDMIVLDEMHGIVDAAKRSDALTKVIIEVGYLTDAEKIRACHLAMQARVDFVKTSTGYGPKGADPNDVRLLKRTLGPGTRVKAAGGIRTLSDALRFIEAGATRLGTSSAVAIMEQLTATHGD